MKTRSVLNFALLCSAPLACTDADAPPPRATFYFTAYAGAGSCGIDPTKPTSLPPTNTRIGVAGPATSEAELKEMDTLKDGADDASVSCDFAEVAPGSYEISVSVKRRDVLFTLSGTTANNQAANAYVSYKATTTGNQTYESSTCTFSVSNVPEGGGSGLINLDCTGLSYRLMPNSVCEAEGVVYVKDCGK